MVKDNQQFENFWEDPSEKNFDQNSVHKVNLDRFEGMPQIDDAQVAIISDNVRPVVSAQKNRRLGPLSMIGGGILVIGGALISEWAIHLVKVHTVLAAPVGLGGALIIFGLGWAGFREMRTLTRLRNAEFLHDEISRLTKANAPWRQASDAVAHLIKVGSQTHVKSFEELNGLMESFHTAPFYFASFEKKVLIEMDDQAQAAISRAVRDTFFLTVLAQTPTIDTAAFTFRAFMLLREIAYSYGGRPGPVARARIMVTALQNVATISLTDILVTDLIGAAGAGVEAAIDTSAATFAVLDSGVVSGVVAAGAKGVAKTLGIISEKVAEDIAIGTVSARRMALFGFLVVGTCRPMQLGRDRGKQMGEVVMNQLVDLITNARKNPNA